MSFDEYDPIELWDLQKPIIQPRSRLYDLEPIGVGTPYVESLTGYVQRLAETHCLVTGILVLTEIAPLLKPDYVFTNKELGLGQIFGSDRDTRRLNGTTLKATTTARALSTLTGHKNLYYLTMSTWAEVLPGQGLLRQFRAWCSICYEQWRVDGQAVYEPLIWALDAVKVCLCHHQPLQTRCPHCHKQLDLLAWYSRPGYCSKCGKWLGISPESKACNTEVLSAEELEWQLWAVENTGELIAAAPNLSSPIPRVRIKEVISAYVNHVSGGNISNFARLVRQPPSVLHRWFIGKTAPSLSKVLQICYWLKTSPFIFLTEEVVGIDSSRLITVGQHQPQHHHQRLNLDVVPDQPQYQYKRLDIEKAQAILQAALLESPPPSMKEVALRLEVTKLTLRHHFLDLYSAISSRHNEYEKNKRLQEIQIFLEAVLESEEYPPPSMQEVARRFNCGSKHLRKHFPDKCRAISKRYLEYKKACGMKRREMLRQEIWQIGCHLHAQGVELTNSNVSQLLRQPKKMLNHEVIAALSEVRLLLSYTKEGDGETLFVKYDVPLSHDRDV